MTSSARVKTFAAAVMLATAGSAQAAMIPPEGLFFSAWNGNPEAVSSMVINLNKTTPEFLSNPDTNFSLSGASLTALTSWLGSLADLSIMQWNVTGAMLGPSPGPTYGGLSTSTEIETASPFGWGLFTGLDAAVGNYEIFRNVTAENLATTDAFSASNPNQLFSAQFNGGVGFATLGTLGQFLPFYAFFADQDGNEFFEGDFTKFANGWKLDFTAGGPASLTYAPIPVPAAVWLMGSALVALVGISRRKVGLKGDNDHEV